MISMESLFYIMVFLTVLAIFIPFINHAKSAAIYNANRGVSSMMASINSLHFTMRSYANMGYYYSSNVKKSMCFITRPTQVKYVITICDVMGDNLDKFSSVALYYNTTRRDLS